jgi:hypothetical protein
MNEKATDAIDYGYDAISFDNFNDIHFSTNGWKLIIQEYFEKSSSYPIGKKQMHQEVQF